VWQLKVKVKITESQEQWKTKITENVKITEFSSLKNHKFTEMKIPEFSALKIRKL